LRGIDSKPDWGNRRAADRWHGYQRVIYAAVAKKTSGHVEARRAPSAPLLGFGRALFFLKQVFNAVANDFQLGRNIAT
jgi:hypothetical protein